MFQIIISQVLLGICKILTLPLLLCLNFLLCLCVICLTDKTNWQIKRIRFIHYFKNLNAVFILQLIAVSYGLIIFLCFLTPVYAWDSITYHLLAVFQWIKAKKILMLQPICATSFFPMNGELMMLWVHLLSKNMHILKLVQLPFAFMFSFSSYNLAKKLNIQSAQKVIPLLLLTPVIMLQCSIAYVDVIFACFFMISLNFIFSYLQTKSIYFFFLSCISLGILSGIKPAGFLIFIISLFFIGAAAKQKLAKKFLSIGFALLVCAGGFWHIRNIILTGNPVFPYTLKVFKVNLFNGIINLQNISPFAHWFVNNKWQWLVYPFMEKIRGEFSYSIENGFGAQFALAVISVVYAFYLSIRKKDKNIFCILLIFPITIFLWLKTSTCAVPRYIIALCAIGAIALTYVYDHLNKYQKKILDFLIFYTLIFSFTVTLPGLIPYQSNVLHRYFKHKKTSFYQYYNWHYGELGSAWKWLDKHIPQTGVIAYNYPELITPLYGAKLQHNIIHIITYDTPYKTALKTENYLEWIILLKEYNVSYFFVYIPYWNQEGIGKDCIWAKRHPEKFTKIKAWNYADKKIIIYKVDF
ncbi:MAG: hypothetical protein DRP78_04075 [Candidatus Omnitrophota bacterium]|nr:MAG: hypothetical protein DRP78_04075 [Candidatus Omnitrophota bacterium]